MVTMVRVLPSGGATLAATGGERRPWLAVVESSPNAPPAYHRAVRHSDVGVVSRPPCRSYSRLFASSVATTSLPIFIMG